ncbi:MAG: hypothetical protein WD512_00260, partial [Candidatus Paceibacterota bacterium]
METNINFFAIIDETASTQFVKANKVVYYTHPNETILFGNFTPEECSKYQGVQVTAASSLTETKFINKPVSLPYPLTPSYFRPFQCSRCGYSSHTMENCVARRNIFGEFISHTSPMKNCGQFRMAPSSPPPKSSTYSETHYYNNHLIQNVQHPSDKTDYSQFVFTADDIYDWTCEQQSSSVLHPLLPPASTSPFQVVYVPMIIQNHAAQYDPVVVGSIYSEQDIIDYSLRCNYAMTNYMFGVQAAYV